jgi:catechol 2,3-dioxygenase-like lactoylglutathione lyase family enzyme
MATTVNHMGMTVSDMDASVTFYKQLGFQERGPMDLVVTGHSWLADIVALEGAEIVVSYLSFGPFTLELIQYRQPEGGSHTPLEVNDAGSVHIGLEVDDVHAEYERLSALGVKFRGAPVTIPYGDHVFGGVVSIYGYDPDGNTFEMQTFPATGKE